MESTWEKETLALLHEAESDKQDAERLVEEAQREVKTQEDVIIGLRLALTRYRKKYGIPNKPDSSPVVESQYGHLGPSLICERWADLHNGEIIVKDVARELLRTRIYKDYKTSYNTVANAVRRKYGFFKVGPGHFRREASRKSLFGGRAA